ncbi:1-aminocyclopropane-1-carboxylate oxidase homolog 1-like [Silene latifolia]|uniref:1-aminocyclopropane-1-carboxylate oxidase homolog 1-like n=1 Tax=Silene latifolia TaxID=37657 RepID=UPI003D77F490
MDTIIASELQGGGFDREKERKAFDETKAGTKGLADSGINILPKMFIQPSDERVQNSSIHDANLRVPVIDLAGLDNDIDREKIVQEVLYASQKWGFFHVLNHGIPMDVLDRMIEGIKMFHEQDLEAKEELYSRGKKQVEYNSNYDRRMKAAIWRDTLAVNCSYTDHLDPKLLPPICRNTILDHIDEVLKLGNTILELLSLALGLKPDCLKEMEGDKGWTCVYHYYPPCPQPELALGTEKHSDSSFITVLAQNQIGGLQVLHENQWVDVQPIPGALIINIGDILQMISNDKLKSVLHRVRANRVGPRISAAFFFTGLATSPKTCAPIKELISEQNPPMYREFTIGEFFANYFSRSLNEDRYKHFMI